MSTTPKQEGKPMFFRNGDTVKVGDRVGVVMRPHGGGYVNIQFEGSKVYEPIYYTEIVRLKNG